MDMSDFKELYASESREHLDLLNDALLTLENNPNDMEMINEAFRAAHTLKGMAGTMGFDNVSELAHAMENVMDLIRDETLAVNTEVINLLFKAVDMLELLSSSPEETSGLDTLIKELKAYSQGDVVVEKPANTTANLKQDNDFNLTQEEIEMTQNAHGHPMTIRVKLEEDCVFKSLRADMVLDALEEHGELIKANPEIEKIKNEEFEHTFYVLFSTKDDKDIIYNSLNSVSEVEEVEINLIEDITELLIKEDTKPKEESKTTSEDNEKKKPKAATLSKRLKSNNTIRVDVERLDSLMNLVAELVIKRTQVESVGRSYNLDELNKKLKPLSKVTTELQNAVMEMRMVPISLVFNRFPRLVRDLSQELDKNINLVIEGEDTELDRTIIDEIGDPLVHMIRNSIDHGVESPAKREAAGKDPVGLVRLSAFHEGNNVVIQIQDDGNGIDPEFIGNMAVEKGVISQSELETMSDNEIIKLIFAAGFSTAAKVSDVSGRGVGMDVVKNKIESLSGSVDITSQVGKGSIFTIKLPLTLSIIQGFLTKVANQEYVIPLESIQEIVDVNLDEIQTIRKEKVIHRRGSVIPLISLRNKLNKAELAEKRTEIPTVIVEVGDENYGLMVDSIIGQQEVVIKRINDLSENLQKIAGGAILGDGSIALIINVEEITTG
ncbi:two-component system chemotaxis sensor kinase CheA [Orenia metallireducens]|uniref:Chemotaxis protein CheA n=1 Tax=Orenia metallireducens TaxID=1413210 RepID=A0A285GPS6_9FIRM|nr:chemotaxis protein CheA [Orenia metallireducens]PRX29901.1 two-component system chemotaxis sensor kinase CheA [Orenia metallireducens]SNY25569.1 two-component system, chemotaxis family, sensor kinase CheA [Orenia metallireducens]